MLEMETQNMPRLMFIVSSFFVPKFIIFLCLVLWVAKDFKSRRGRIKLAGVTLFLFSLPQDGTDSVASFPTVKTWIWAFGSKTTGTTSLRRFRRLVFH